MHGKRQRGASHQDSSGRATACMTKALQRSHADAQRRRREAPACAHRAGARSRPQSPFLQLALILPNAR